MNFLSRVLLESARMLKIITDAEVKNAVHLAGWFLTNSFEQKLFLFSSSRIPLVTPN